MVVPPHSTNFTQSDITLEGDEIECVLNEIKVIFKKRSRDGVQLYSFCCNKTGQVKVCMPGHINSSTQHKNVCQ